MDDKGQQFAIEQRLAPNIGYLVHPIQKFFFAAIQYFKIILVARQKKRPPI